MKSDIIAAKIAKLQIQRRASVDEEICFCKHPLDQIRECDYQALNYGSLPPMRICLLCGLSEEGWGAGHYFLARQLSVMEPNISRDELNRLSKFYLTQDDYWHRYHSIKDGVAKAEDFYPKLQIFRKK